MVNIKILNELFRYYKTQQFYLLFISLVKNLYCFFSLRGVGRVSYNVGKTVRFSNVAHEVDARPNTTNNLCRIRTLYFMTSLTPLSTRLDDKSCFDLLFLVTPTESVDNKATIIGLSVGGGCFILVIIIVILVYVRRSKDSNR